MFGRKTKTSSSVVDASIEVPMGMSMINEAGGWGPVRGSSVDLPRSDEGGERDGKKQNHNGASSPLTQRTVSLF